MGGKGAVAIIKAFKAAVDYRIVASLPNMLCDSCPINHLNILCKKLNGEYTYVYDMSIKCHHTVTVITLALLSV